MQIGFIGLGLMGSAIAERLIALDYHTTVYDVSAEAISRLVDLGGTGTRSLREIATNDVVALCVPNGAVLRKIVSDPEFRTGLSSGATVIDFSTVAPEDSIWAETELTKYGARFIDTPIGRTPAHARRGELLVMAGCEGDLVGPVRQLLESVSNDIVFCGSVGSGSTMKLVNNLCNQTILFATVEALTFAAASGIDLEIAYEVLSRTNANNGHLQSTVKERVFTGEFSGGFKLSLAHKDIRLALEAANVAGAAAPVSGASLQAAALAIIGGEGDSDSSGYFRWLQNNRVSTL